MSRLEASPPFVGWPSPGRIHVKPHIFSSRSPHRARRTLATGQPARLSKEREQNMEKRPYETDPERSSGCAAGTGRRPPVPETIRSDGLRNLRRMSNWSLAALVVGIGATTGALAAATQSKTVGTAAVTTTAGATTSATGAVQSGPTLGSPVATTSASGVTVSAAAQQRGVPSAMISGRVIATGSGDS